MSKTIIIALLIVSLVGGGAVFAEYGSPAVFLGLNNDTVEKDFEKGKASENKDEERSETADTVHEALSDGEAPPEDESSFGEKVSERSRDEKVNLGMEVSQAARENKEENENNNTNENGNDDERSDVAKAVHEALNVDTEITPESDNFGKKVSNRVRDGDINLGEEVSDAARKVNGSLEEYDELDNDEENNEDVNSTGNVNDNGKGINTGNSLFNNNDNSGNIGNPGNGGSPGNSGNRGNSGNAGGGRPGN